MRFIPLVVLTTAASACGIQEEPDLGHRQEAVAAVPGECYLVGDNDDRLSIVTRGNTDPMNNEVDVGLTTVDDIEALAVSPLTKIVYVADAEQLGTLDVDTGLFTALPQVFGIADGALGGRGLDDADGLSFDPCTGEFYGSHRQNNGS